MKRGLFWIGLALVLLVLNGLVWRQNNLAANGETIYLKLAPRDPRSMMQGDYMALHYQVENNWDEHQPRQGTLVVGVAPDHVGTFKRFHSGEPLAADERLIRYKYNAGLHIAADSYFFEEGHGDDYAGARYGELKVDRGGTCLLIGLRDELMHPLGPR